MKCLLKSLSINANQVAHVRPVLTSAITEVFAVGTANLRETSFVMTEIQLEEMDVHRPALFSQATNAQFNSPQFVIR